MSDKLVDKSCVKFADELAAKLSVPGGGGAAAYVGALGVALGSMVGNFTAGKPKYAAYEEDVQRMLERAEAIRCRLIDLVDEDAQAFFPLSQAYAIPQEDPRRADVLEQCTKDALAGPFAMMQQICMAIELLEEMGAKGSRLLISDVGCGAALCQAALESAALNVYINTKGLADRDYAQQIEADCDAMLEEYVPRARKVLEGVSEEIRG
ncbi:MAG: cyclodeaminase/cyclohydrolase family protein [Eggerthellaceae bacterium]|nr:cyclodeaminase/cyclohydrolase family protein [Eggerthellaceae bacterium]